MGTLQFYLKFVPIHCLTSIDRPSPKKIESAWYLPLAYDMMGMMLQMGQLVVVAYGSRRNSNKAKNDASSNEQALTDPFNSRYGAPPTSYNSRRCASRNVILRTLVAIVVLAVTNNRQEWAVWAFLPSLSMTVRPVYPSALCLENKPLNDSPTAALLFPSPVWTRQHHRVGTSSSHIPSRNIYCHDRRCKRIQIFSSSSADDYASTSSFLSPSLTSSAATSAVARTPKIDQILSKLTSLFPLFVLGSAILGSYAPNTLNWVNQGNWISLMLAG